MIEPKSRIPMERQLFRLKCTCKTVAVCFKRHQTPVQLPPVTLYTIAVPSSALERVCHLPPIISPMNICIVWTTLPAPTSGCSFKHQSLPYLIPGILPYPIPTLSYHIPYAQYPIPYYPLFYHIHHRIYQ